MSVFFSRSRAAAALLGAALTTLTPLGAKASPIVGNFSFSGANTFDQNGISFTNPGYVISSTIPGVVGLQFLPTPYVQPVYLTSFQYSSAAGTELFTTTNGVATVTFTISSDPTLLSIVYTPATTSSSATLVIQGYGTITDTGYSDTPGKFSLTSSTTGATSFQVVGDSPDAPAVVPEPGSLLLVGTGLLGAAMTLRRRSLQNSAV